MPGDDRAEPIFPAVELLTAERPELVDAKPAAAPAPWIRPISRYERRQTTLLEGTRYG
jgi:hypothetical protein